MELLLVAVVAAVLGGYLATRFVGRAGRGDDVDRPLDEETRGPLQRVRVLLGALPTVLPAVLPAVLLPGGRNPAGRRVVRGALEQARRYSDDGPMRLPGVDVHAHPEDHPLLLDTRDLLEKAVRRAARARRIQLIGVPCLRRFVADPGVLPGEPRVRVSGSPGARGTVTAATAAATASYTEDAHPEYLHAEYGDGDHAPPYSAPGPVRARRVLPPADLARLVTVDEAATVFAVPGTGGMVGRDGERCVITVDLPTVSRVHAELQPTPGGFTVFDRGSANGTRINGTVVRRGTLRHDDVLGLGRTVRLRLRLTDG